MPVSVYNNQRKVRFEKGQWDRAFLTALRVAGHADGLVEVSFVSNSVIAGLNREWRGKDGPTDVLSFPFAADVPLPPGTPRPLGDVVISLEQAAAQGPLHVETLVPGRDALFFEVLFLFIHSLLHLLGHDHETGPDDERAMYELQNEIFRAVVTEIA